MFKYILKKVSNDLFLIQQSKVLTKPEQCYVRNP